MNNLNKKPCIAFVSTFPPRECGIATFTQDLVNALDELFSPKITTKIVAMNQNELAKYIYPKKVFFQISQANIENYIEAAKKINSLSNIKLVNIQHEFGIYGGKYGSYLIEFMKSIKKPIVITMHTVLPNPDQEMRKIVSDINDYSRIIFVMTKTSKNILIEKYGIREDKVKIVPHGIHHGSYMPSDKAKKDLGFKNKIILSTFGLLSKGKGIEYVIEALPNIVKKYPNVLYLIIGATHPVVLQQEGESYRELLTNKIKELGLENNISFYNEYLETETLLKFLKATDIYLSTSLDPDQAVSGTLSYALGSGKPVISTSFAQAKEDITEDVGILVNFRDPKQIEDALNKLLENQTSLEQMGRNAYFRTRNMVWQNVAISYMRNFISILPELNKSEKNIPKIKINHLINMTDKFGIFQFAKLTEPDPKFGYTLDDNARALMVATNYYKFKKNPQALKLAKIYLNFIEYVVSSNAFFNYVDINKNINSIQNSNENLEDAGARGLLALATVTSSVYMPEDLRNKAKKIFIESNIHNNNITSPRAISFYIKALCKWHTFENNEIFNQKIQNYADYLVDIYKNTNTSGWEWFEDILAYSNAVIPESLLMAYRKTGDQRYFNVAKITLDFLISHSFKENVCTPIGQKSWFKKGSERTYFDQQPEEVAALVEALNTMFDITKDEKYKNLMINAFNWFLGNNLLGQVVYDQATGGCYDGVQETNVNLNQGAESTVSYLLARLKM